MAERKPKSARFALSLNAGTNLATGAMIRKSISFGNLMPDCDAGAISVVANSIGALLDKEVTAVTITENDQLI